MRKVSYPFLPKSNTYLIPGQFWAIPLKSNKFACGRVIEVSKEDKRGFLAGLMDWVVNTLHLPKQLQEQRR
ncbi:Imm26 family immunity protein [Neobacillus cucumis]|uniref:Imm26 family immunity protein n=1 Tax=Neobacillus cucumis TaxID=1740721 RepID=UPI002E1F67E0|nr:Imm26 family immunity protein [Neobacillus cucumis]